ncbi:MAG: hypothetical protein ACI8WB_003553, partial [Phenylobacterium sp.]
SLLFRDYHVLFESGKRGYSPDSMAIKCHIRHI